MSALDLQSEPGDDADLPEDKTPADAAPLPAEEPEGPGAVVSLAPKLSRRAQAAQEQRQAMETLTSTVNELRSGLGARDQELARLRGFAEAQAQQSRYVPQQQQAPQIPDPNVLMREAKQALDNRDFDGYHEKLAAAGEARALRAVAPAFQDLQARVQQYQQQQPANSMPPAMMAMFAAYPDVASHPRGVELLSAKNTELDVDGVPPGETRLRRVFAEVNAKITASRKTNGSGAQYSQSSASALAGIPMSRGGGGGAGGEGGGGPGITLTAPEAEVARKLEKQGLMSKADYAKGLANADPSRISR